jgi:hypothetical protein
MRNAIVALLLLGHAAGAIAQGGTTITGTVVDQTGAVLPGVTVHLVSAAVRRDAVTDDAGVYRLTGVGAGTVELTFRLLNFTVVRRTAVVQEGRAETIDVVMSLSLQADVLVTGTSTFRNIAEVENPAEMLVGIASAASQGAITWRQLEARPIMRAGEVLETVPGMIVSQHSGEGKANQYYIRGFNLDHGTDFSTTVVGVPVNTPTGAHAHGYTDIGFLIPELVSGVQFKKGPYFADEGDFSAAGAANINYVNHLETPIVRVGAGSHGWRRVLGAASPRIGSGSLLAAAELNHSDGPWVRPDDYEKVNTVVRYSRGDNRNGFTLTSMSLWSDWNSTDQIPQRAVDEGMITRFGLIDRTNGGQFNRHSLAAELQRAAGPSLIRANAFVLRNHLDLFSNFTYFLDDPENGDQFEQSERRTTVGGRFSVRRLGRVASRHTESAVGLQVRRDWLSPVGLYRTVGRERIETTREDRVGQTMLGVYGETAIEWLPTLRTTLGARADVYQFQVTSNQPANSGAGSETLLSPKFAAAIGPWAGTEFYINAGQGFHSNDARGAVMTVAPRSGEPVERVTPFVRANGAEVGLRTVRFRGLQSTFALWYLTLDSELLFVGDAGTTEAGRPSRRVGIEWANYARLTPWLTADVDVAFSRARFRDDDPAGNAIPGALDRVISAGLTIEPSQRLFGSLRVRHFGPRPLIEDRSILSNSTTLWNGEAGFRVSRHARIVLELFNLFDARVADIDYFYRSRLPFEPADGVDDIHTHPALPRSARVGLQMMF